MLCAFFIPAPAITIPDLFCSYLRAMSSKVYSCIDQMGNKLSVSFPPTRIISLVPSQTELLADLGLSTEVVGVTKFCIHPGAWKTKIRVGGTKHFNHEVIDQLAPDLILGNKEENYQDGIEALQKKYPVWMSDITSLTDALAMIRSIGALTDRGETAQDLIAEISARFDQLPKFRPATVLYLIWRRPWMAAACDTFIDHMLSVIGLQNVVRKTRYPELTGEEIQVLNPDLIFLSSEPYPFKENHIAELRVLCSKAKVMLVDGEMFSWYGSRLLKAPDYFRGLNL
jgi:ABC-type Fe3+-hydroxamate transport system substrate-binding protein